MIYLLLEQTLEEFDEWKIKFFEDKQIMRVITGYNYVTLLLHLLQTNPVFGLSVDGSIGISYPILQLGHTTNMTIFLTLYVQVKK